MNHITATIITQNEQDNIERCLNSLSGIADEIIVVDSFSTDNTLAVCERYGCKITQRAFTGYGIQRQYATSLASHKYILAIDADEVLSEELRASILKIKQEGFIHRVYSFVVAEYYFGIEVRHCALDHKPKTRLFNKRYAQWNLHDVGEKVTFSESLRPQILNGPLLHYRANTLAEFKKKEQLRAKLNAAGIAAHRKNITALTPRWQWLKTYVRMMLWRRAIADGKTGRIISRVVADSSHVAYSTARQLLKTQSK